jgi:hypothetical protein
MKQAPQVKKASGSLFASFFVIEEGVISFSLSQLTVFFSVLCTILMLGMLYLSCTNGTFECSREAGLPMISDVIGSTEFFNRIFLLVTTSMMFGV